MILKIFSGRWLMMIAMVAAVCFSSCKKTLEVKAYSYFTGDSFFSSLEAAQLATTGIYAAAANTTAYGWNIPIVFDYDNDISQMAAGTSPNWRIIPHYIGIPETDMYYESWSALYQGIDRANDVLEKIPVMDLYGNGTIAEKAQLNRLMGEAKFLRAFYASELVRFWGDVPFKTKSSVAGDNLKGALVSRDTIYTQIVKDLKEAADLLPDALPTDERVNKWAAKALLARIALFAGGYSLRPDGNMKRPDNYRDYYVLAQQQINDIMASNPYKLNASYPQVFINQCQHVLEPTENIFQIAFFTPVDPALGENVNRLGVFNSVTGTGAARVLAIRPFYDSIPANDLRRDFAVARYRLTETNGIFTRNYAGVNDRTWTVAKWSKEFQTNSVSEQSSSDINHVVMRYADLLLLRAEVENELNNGPNTIALDAINEVRRRAYGLTMPGNSITVSLANAGSGYTAVPAVQVSGGGGKFAAASVTRNTANQIASVTLLNPGYGYTTAPTVTITGGGGTGAVITASLVAKPAASEVDVPVNKTKEEFFKIIVDERAKELCFEGMRRADLIRWNLLKAKIDETLVNVLKVSTTYPYPAATNFITGKHELFPFPQNEIDVNRSITRQNPGY